MDVCHIRQRAYLQRPDVSRQPVTHDGDKLRMYLVLMLLIILYMRKHYQHRGAQDGAMQLTRLSLSNSMSMTACFWLRCRRNVSRMYGMSEIMIASDCDARAVGVRERTVLFQAMASVPRCFAVMFLSPADRIAPAPRTT